VEYTIKKLAQLADVSSRTLRYYDEIRLLKPWRINSSGYRIYREKEVDVLQQILFYRSMDLKLNDIKDILDNPDFNISTALAEHHQRLLLRRNQIDQLISTVEKTIAYNKGEKKMSNKEKFEGFKQEKLARNESEYGKEIREKYGEKTVEASNLKFGNMSEEDYEKMQEVEAVMFSALKEVISTKDLDSASAKMVFEKHKEWLSFTWPDYSGEAHVGLAEMYVADERFAKYYNDRARNEIGAETGFKADLETEKSPVQMLRDIIVKYAK